MKHGDIIVNKKFVNIIAIVYIYRDLVCVICMSYQPNNLNVGIHLIIEKIITKSLSFSQDYM